MFDGERNGSIDGPSENPIYDLCGIVAALSKDVTFVVVPYRNNVLEFVLRKMCYPDWTSVQPESR